MSTEAAFLQQLASDPGDDLTRLVYADWLEENGDERGVYLRQEIELAPIADHDERYAPLEAELRERQSRIDPGWLAQAGKRFDLVFYGCNPRQRIPVLKTHRTITQVSLLEAKRATELPPCCLAINLPRGVGEQLRQRYCDSASQVDVQLLPTDFHSMTYSAYYVADHPTLTFVGPPQLTDEIVQGRREGRQRIADRLTIHPEVLETHDLRTGPLLLRSSLLLATALALQEAGAPFIRVLITRQPRIEQWAKLNPAQWDANQPYELVLERFDSSARPFVAKRLASILNCSLEQADARLDHLPLTIPAGLENEAVWAARQFRGTALGSVVPLEG